MKLLIYPNFLCIFQFDIVFVCALLWSLVLYVHPESLVVTGARLQLSPRQDAKVSEQSPWMLRIFKCLQASNIASAIDVESWLQSSTIQFPPWQLDIGLFPFNISCKYVRLFNDSNNHRTKASQTDSIKIKQQSVFCKKLFLFMRFHLFFPSQVKHHSPLAQGQIAKVHLELQKSYETTSRNWNGLPKTAQRAHHGARRLEALWFCVDRMSMIWSLAAMPTKNSQQAPGTDFANHACLDKGLEKTTVGWIDQVCQFASSQALNSFSRLSTSEYLDPKKDRPSLPLIALIKKIRKIKNGASYFFFYFF